MDVILEHVGSCDVYGQVKDFPGFAAKRGEVEEGAAWLEVDQEIHVAFGRSFAACEGSEGAQMTDPVPLGGVEKSAAMAPQLIRLRTELSPH